MSPNIGAYSPLKPIPHIVRPCKVLKVPQINEFKNDSLSINEQNNSLEKPKRGLRVIGQVETHKFFEQTGISDSVFPKEKPVGLKNSPLFDFPQKVFSTAKSRKS